MSTTAPALTDETWTYLGRRGGQSGKLLELWLDEAGDDRLFEATKGAAGRTVGATYLIGVDRAADGAFNGAVLTGVRFDAEPDTDDERVPRWVAEDRGAQTEQTARRRAERAKRDASARFGDLTLNDVRGLLANGGPQRYALLANVLRHIGA